MIKDNRARLESNESVGEYRLMRFMCPELAESCSPGQFVQVRLPNPSGVDPLLRRPLSVMNADPETGEVEFLVQLVGRGTELLAGLEAGGELWMLGPLGNGFGLDATPGRMNLLVAGGTGIASVFFAGRRLMAAGALVQGFWGLRSPDPYLALSRDLENSGMPWLTSAENGEGCHVCGLVTDALEQWLDRGGHEPGGRPANVLACGPLPMLRRLMEILGRGHASIQVSLEERMACGYGVCMGCAVPLAAGGYGRACLDGPVFSAYEVDWGRLQ